jgi:flagellar motility protein MotE (MotC chaperone)
MDPLINQLTRLRGVGQTLAARFRDSGLNSFDRIVDAGEEGLKKIKGINPRAIPAILAQAAELSAEASEKTVLLVRAKASQLSGRVQSIAEDVRVRFGEEMKGKTGKKVEKEILRIASALEDASQQLKKKKKRAAKVFAKVEKRLAAADETGLKELRRCLKKTRKSLKKISPLP